MRNVEVNKYRKPISEIYVDSFAVEKKCNHPWAKPPCPKDVLGEGK
jgi:hypothetical protein